MKENITAHWARKTAATVINENVQKNIKLCLEAIEIMVKRNKFECEFLCLYDDMILHELTKRGFSVEYVEGKNKNIGRFKIKW